MRPTTSPPRPLTGWRPCSTPIPARRGRRTPRSPVSRSTPRQVRPGDLYVALPGNQSHGADFAAEAVPRRRGRPDRPGRPRGRRRDRPARPRRARRRGPCSGRSPPGCTAGRPTTSSCSASPAPAASPPPRSCSRPACGPPATPQGWSAASRSAPATLRSSPGSPPPRPPSCTACSRSCARRRHRGGHGGLQPRPGARPGRRRSYYDVAAVHQPVAGPPRLPRRLRRLLRRQGQALQPERARAA